MVCPLSWVTDGHIHPSIFLYSKLKIIQHRKYEVRSEHRLLHLTCDEGQK
jgi:hypothetical protein